MTSASATATAKMTQPQVLDIRSLWRIPAPSNNRSATATASTDAAKPRARLSRVLGMARPGIDVIDMAPTDFWKTWHSSTQISSSSGSNPTGSPTAGGTAAPAEVTVVAIVGDFLRDKVEDKSLPWYVPFAVPSPANKLIAPPRSAYFFSLLSSFTDWKGTSFSLVFRNELGSSLPLILRPRDRASISSSFILGSLRRENDGRNEKIQYATWIGYLRLPHI